MQIRLGNALPLHILLDMYISTCDTFTRWEVRLVLFPGRGTPIQLTSYFSTGDPYVYKSSKDRSSLCAFTYADGGHCRMPRNFADYRYCSDHELKICRFVHDEVALESSSSCLMAPFPFRPHFLSHAPACCRRRSRIDPKTGVALARIAETLRKTISDSTNEFCSAFHGANLDGLVRLLQRPSQPPYHPLSTRPLPIPPIPLSPAPNPLLSSTLPAT